MQPILLNFPLPIITSRLLITSPKVGEGSILNDAVIESFERLHQAMPWASRQPTLIESEIYVRQAAANWILKKNHEPYLPLFIYDKNSNVFIGATGYHNYEWEIPRIEIGYWVRTSQAGKGFITEAVNALTRYAFTQLKVNRVAITCDINNIPSKNIAEKLGFVQEGRLKAHRRHPVTHIVCDTLIYARYDLKDLPVISVGW